MKDAWRRKIGQVLKDTHQRRCSPLCIPVANAAAQPVDRHLCNAAARLLRSRQQRCKVFPLRGQATGAEAATATQSDV